MFTGALAHVLAGERKGTGRALSFADIAYEASKYIQLTHGLKAVLPQCHTPRHDVGDLARAPLFGGGLLGDARVAEQPAAKGSALTTGGRVRF